MANSVVNYVLDLVILCPRSSQTCPRSSHLCPPLTHLCPPSSQICPRLSHLCPRSNQSCLPSIRFEGSRELPPSWNPWTDFAVYGLSDASFGVLMATHNFKGSKPSKISKKEAWLGIFQPNWQNHKIAISPTANIGSTPNFHRTTEHIVEFVGCPE